MNLDVRTFHRVTLLKKTTVTIFYTYIKTLGFLSECWQKWSV